MIKGADKANQVFKIELALFLLLVCIVMIIERYIARTDKIEAPKEDEIKNKEEGGYFRDEIFKGEDDALQQTIKF